MQLALFEWAEAVIRPSRRKRAKPGWTLVDHACRHCMGRVLTSVRPETGAPFSRCAECGAEEDGAHDNLCWCGVEMPGHGRVFECLRNQQVSQFDRQEIMVQEKPLGAETGG